MEVHIRNAVESRGFDGVQPQKQEQSENCGILTHLLEIVRFLRVVVRH